MLGIAAALALSVATWSYLESRPPSRCDPAYGFLTRDSATTYLLARATGDTVAVRQPAELPQSRRTFLGEHMLFGQLARLQRIEGPGGAAVDRTMTARGSQDVVIVPWQYGMDCQPWLWSGTARWITPGTSGVFSVALRPESLWSAGRPTFDAWMAVARSYADGPFTRGPGTRLESPAPPNLSAAQFFDLLVALPTDAEVHNPLARTRLRAWMRSHPEAENKYPSASLWVWWTVELSRAP